MESDWEIVAWLLKYFKGQEITTFKFPTFPRQQSVMTEHLVLVASLFIFYFFLFVWAVRVKMPPWSRQDHYSRDVAIWSVKHPSVELSVDQTFVAGHKECFRVVEETSCTPCCRSLFGIYWAVSHTLRNLSCQSALLQAPGRQALADSSLKVAPDCSLII